MKQLSRFLLFPTLVIISLLAACQSTNYSHPLAEGPPYANPAGIPAALPMHNS